MPRFEIDLHFIRKDGELIGYSLIALPHTESEMFCSIFPRELLAHQADIALEEGKVIFKSRKQGNCEFDLSETQLDELRELLTRPGTKDIFSDGFMTAGFKIVINGMGEEGEKELVAGYSMRFESSK